MRRPVHVCQRTDGADDTSVAAPREGATSRLSPFRVACGALAAETAAAAQRALVARGLGAYTDNAIARRLGISHAAVARFFDPESGVALTLRDVFAAGDELVEELALAMLSMVHEQRAPMSTRDSLDHVAIELGAAVAALHRDLADGTEDEHHQHGAALRRIAGIALRGAAASARRAG